MKGQDHFNDAFNANGHGTASGDQQLERYCSVQLERIYGLLV